MTECENTHLVPLTERLDDQAKAPTDHLNTRVASLAKEDATQEYVHEETHEYSDIHHRHSHAERSQHAGGHHLLQVEDLSVSFSMYDPEESFFRAQKKEVAAIHNLSLAVHEGEILAVVGASGSGKTLLADALLGLFEPNALVKGRIWFNGQEQDGASLAALRGKGISLVPQSTTHLDPLMRVGKQVSTPPQRKRFSLKKRNVQRKDHANQVARQKGLFSHYGFNDEVNDLYPFELSGGMTRRILLMTALMDDPQLIIADEPTPGLDLDLAVKALADFRAFADKGNGVLLITHDIELALHVADRVAVFQEGTVIEETAVENFASPDLLRHPFSKALWHALPEHDFITPKE